MLLPYAALEQYVQRVAFASPLSAHAGHVSIRGPGGADFSLRRDPGHPRHAMITKSTTEPRRLPTAMVVRTLPSGAALSGIRKARHSPPPTNSDMIGMSTSATTEDTTLLMAVPMMTATARASALVLRRHSKSSLIKVLFLLGRLLSDDLALGPS